MSGVMQAPALATRLQQGLQWRWQGWLRQRQRAHLKSLDRQENARFNSATPTLLFVSESLEQDHFYRCLLDWMRVHRPQLRQHVRLDRMPCQAREHGNVALLHAWVQDPVRERDPELWRQLGELEGQVRSSGGEVVQPARVLSHSERVSMMQRLSSAGVRVARSAVLDEQFPESLAGLGYPLIVRPRYGHGSGMQRVDERKDIDTGWARWKSDPAAWVAMEYIDVMDDDGYFRKYRYLQVGHQGMPRHLMRASHWEVRPEGRIRDPQAQEEELAYVSGTVPEADLFTRAARALEFDVAAFDYSYDANRELVIWEANPYPDIGLPDERVSHYLQATVERSWALYCDYYAARAGLV
ncbi:hypothetical protein [Aestuariirhabdus sp. LZHN29]|uniref:hypothetical protein n=1 Tax=Aestuariirhabdus sp. LZHN29 TaxID=3417462 RepID=UPI003CEDE3FC